MSRSGEGYISITVKLLERRETSLRVDRPDLSAPVWLVRGWLEKIDNVMLDRAEIGSTITVRVLGDRANEKGLV